MTAISEDGWLHAKPVVDKKKEEKDTDPTFERMNIDEYYRFKSDHLDETDSVMDKELHL